MAGFFSKFQDEEELEQWYAEEKEKLDTAFAKAIDGQQDHVPKAREQYNYSLKKLVSKYQEEYARLIPRILKRK